MSYHFDPALESELAYRRHALVHDADTDRLARHARLRTRAARAARHVLAPTKKNTVRAA